MNSAYNYYMKDFHFLLFPTHFLSKGSENGPSNKDDDGDDENNILLCLLFPGYLQVV